MRRAGTRAIAFSALIGALLHCAAGTASATPYIVVLKQGVDAPTSVARQQADRLGIGSDRVFRTALKGYSADIPPGKLDALRRDSRVAYVEPDRRVSAAAQALPWGINRIDADLSSTRAGNGSGWVGGVDAYVIDTGIDRHHADLNVIRHVNFAGGVNRDCNGHGTHVAGTIGARDNGINVVGAAPGVRLTGVKVLGCKASGRMSTVIAGVDWVTSNATRPAVANMSLGGGTSQALDDAVRNSTASGVVYSLAAGNSGADACNYSPTRSGAGTSNGIISTAGADSQNREISWSNYGSCVDLWAPGAGILSTRRGGGTTTMSGTSMAAPHVAGTAALYLSSHPSATPSAVETQLKADATYPGTASKDGQPIRLVSARRY